jgi:hypothetical protein
MGLILIKIIYYCHLSLLFITMLNNYYAYYAIEAPFVVPGYCTLLLRI